MGHPSTPPFCTFHALRIKGFATAETLTEMTGTTAGDVDQHLADLLATNCAQFREAQALWQLTADGRTAHPGALAADLASIDVADALAEPYAAFLGLNVEFKQLCSDWQLRDGAVNDHSDAGYDATVIERLVELDAAAQPVVAGLGDVLDRLAPYATRLSATLARLQRGETNMFTGVMCGSYHDAWMELHEDLILTQGIDRTAEGSF